MQLLRACVCALALAAALPQGEAAKAKPKTTEPAAAKKKGGKGDNTIMPSQLDEIRHAELVKKVVTGDVAAVTAMVSKSNPLDYKINMTDGVEGLTVLHVAAHNGALDVVKVLVDAGADVNHNYMNEHQYAPLHWAAQKGHTGVVIYLLLHGANPDVEANGGLRPLHLAAKWNRAEVCQALLLAFADVDPVHTVGAGRYTPLHHAAAKGSLGAARWLLRFGGDAETRAAGATPLAMAEHENQTKFVKLVQEEKKTALGQWLLQKRMQSLTSKFMNAGSAKVSDLAVYNITMLKNLGIKKKKHVVKLMAKISLLKKAEAKNEKSKIISITESKQTAEKPKKPVTATVGEVKKEQAQEVEVEVKKEQAQEVEVEVEKELVSPADILKEAEEMKARHAKEAKALATAAEQAEGQVKAVDDSLASFKAMRIHLTAGLRLSVQAELSSAKSAAVKKQAVAQGMLGQARVAHAKANKAVKERLEAARSTADDDRDL